MFLRVCVLEILPVAGALCLLFYRLPFVVAFAYAFDFAAAFAFAFGFAVAIAFAFLSCLYVVSLFI